MRARTTLTAVGRAFARRADGALGAALKVAAPPPAVSDALATPLGLRRRQFDGSGELRWCCVS